MRHPEGWKRRRGEEREVTQKKKSGSAAGSKKEELHGAPTTTERTLVGRARAAQAPQGIWTPPPKKKKKKKKNPKEYAPVETRTDYTWRGRRFEGGVGAQAFRRNGGRMEKRWVVVVRGGSPTD